MTICKYCEKKIDIQLPFYKEIIWSYGIIYYHKECLFEKLTDDCPKFEECKGFAIGNHESTRNEGYD